MGTLPTMNSKDINGPDTRQPKIQLYVTRLQIAVRLILGALYSVLIP